MESNISSLLNLDVSYVVANVGQISKDFTAPLNLPSNLIELIFKKYLLLNRYITEREVAYFLTHKAQLTTIDLSSSLYVSNSWIDLLPSSLLSLDVSNWTGLTDDGLLKIVALLPGLNELKLNECLQISEACWTCVSSLTRLQVFEASSTQFGDEALSGVAKSCANMKVLNLSYTRIFKAISELKNLTHLLDLDLDQNKITPGAVIDLSQSLKQLRRFKATFFNNPKFNNVYSELPDSLETLQLDGLSSGVYSKSFGHLTALQRMDMSCWCDDNIFSIENLTRLTRINVDGRLSGTEGYDWSKMKCMRSDGWDTEVYTASLVSCTKVEVELADPQNLTSLTNLRNLRLTAETDNLLETLQRLPNLKKLRFAYQETANFEEFIPLYRQLEIKRLDSSDYHPTLTTLTSLEKLSYFGNEDMDIGYGVLTNLTELEGTTIPLDQIATLTKLRHLDLRYSKYNHIELLTCLTNLTSLDIGGMTFGPESFDALADSLTNLKTLLLMDVYNTMLLFPSFTKLKRLQSLFIDDLPSAESLTLLSELPSLNRLVLCSPPPLTDDILILLQSPSLCCILMHGGQYNDEIVQKFANKGIHLVQ